MKPKDFVTFSPVYRDKLQNGEVKLNIHDMGCGCCSSGHHYTEEEFVVLLDQMINSFTALKEKVQNKKGDPCNHCEGTGKDTARVWSKYEEGVRPVVIGEKEVHCSWCGGTGTIFILGEA
jgi:hypothetical protein